MACACCLSVLRDVWSIPASCTDPEMRSALQSNVAPTETVFSVRGTGAANVAAVSAVLVADEDILISDVVNDAVTSSSSSNPVPGTRA